MSQQTEIEQLRTEIAEKTGIIRIKSNDNDRLFKITLMQAETIVEYQSIIRMMNEGVKPRQFGGASTENEKVSLIFDYGDGDNDYIKIKMTWDKAKELLAHLSMLLGIDENKK